MEVSIHMTQAEVSRSFWGKNVTHVSHRQTLFHQVRKPTSITLFILEETHSGL